MEEGRLPNLSRLAKMGGFSALGTAIPPQSPVAWSDFITGLDAGGHGIFDFIHRDPETMVPYLSTSRTVPPSTSSRSEAGSSRCRAARSSCCAGAAPSGRCSRSTASRRRSSASPRTSRPRARPAASCRAWGRPTSSAATAPSPTTRPTAWPSSASRSRAANVYRVEETDGVVRAQLVGPDNPLKVTPEKLDGRLHGLPRSRPARWSRSSSGDEERLLQEGEWSDWVPVSFDLIPTQHLPVAGPLLPEAGPAGARPLRQPAQLRSPGPGPADLDAGLLRGRAGARHRPLLHAGHARGHGGARGRRLHARGVPRPGEDRGRGGPRPVPVRPRPVRPRPALLLRRQRRPASAT